MVFFFSVDVVVLSAKQAPAALKMCGDDEARHGKRGCAFKM
jgi:hypothetical protein